MLIREIHWKMTLSNNNDNNNVKSKKAKVKKARLIAGFFVDIVLHIFVYFISSSIQPNNSLRSSMVMSPM